ncbi:hypothetical protein MAHJHV33_48570 [Mycobacterium avium subsp. hominissuis]
MAAATSRAMHSASTLSEMMDHSDNVLAECIAREVAAAINRPRSFAGAAG